MECSIMWEYFREVALYEEVLSYTLKWTSVLQEISIYQIFHNQDINFFCGELVLCDSL